MMVLISIFVSQMPMHFLQDAILSLSVAAKALPPLSLRGDWGVLSIAGARYAPSLLRYFVQIGPRGAFGATKLLRPFSDIIDSLGLKDPFVRNWVDLLSFLLAGVKSNGILSAEMVCCVFDTLFYNDGRNFNSCMEH